MTGKGSAPRPLSVSDEEFGKRFDAIDWSVQIDCDEPSDAMMAKIHASTNQNIEADS